MGQEKRRKMRKCSGCCFTQEPHFLGYSGSHRRRVPHRILTAVIMGTGRRHTELSAHQNERIIDPDGYKSRVRQMWSKRASSYDIRNDFHPPLCEQLVALADLRPRVTRVLDVASGTGSVALSAAQVL